MDNMQTKENLIKAAHVAAFLVEDIRSAQKSACEENQYFLEILLREQLEAAVKIKNCLVELEEIL